MDIGSNVRRAEPADTSERDADRSTASAMDVASMTWAFTQQQPIDTADFIAEAPGRGVGLDLPVLRELYRHGLLVPFVSITYLPVT
jgi:hypothetical protein